MARQHVRVVLSRPVENAVIVDALMCDTQVRLGTIKTRDPVIRDHRQVGRAHELLPNNLDTVTCSMSSLSPSVPLGSDVRTKVGVKHAVERQVEKGIVLPSEVFSQHILHDRGTSERETVRVGSPTRQWM